MFAWEPGSDWPLMVAANRDERLDRPAHAMDVLSDRDPRILGGRDELAGGTWLAVNEHGVVAGLTNRPAPGGRDLTRRSRGELPLMLASRTRAEDAVAHLLETVVPGQYNPAWLLVGDRHSLTYIELAADLAPTAVALGPGLHILENVALDEPSPKADRVHHLIAGADGAGSSPWEALPSVLADHVLPPGASAATFGDDRSPRPEATLAACVHTDDYGTRSAALVRVSEVPGSRPRFWWRTALRAPSPSPMSAAYGRGRDDGPAARPAARTPRWPEAARAVMDSSRPFVWRPVPPRRRDGPAGTGTAGAGGWVPPARSEGGAGCLTTEPAAP